MKILHVSPSYFDPTSVMGGGERYVYELAQHMAYRCDTTLLSFGQKREEYNDRLLKVKIYPVAGFMGNNTSDPIPADLSWVEELKHADIIHFHHRRVEITGLGVQYALEFGRKTFVTELGSGGANLLQTFGLDRQIDGWLPISKFAAIINPPAVAGKTKVIYGGVNTDFFKPLPDGVAGKKANQVCYVGRLLPHKGIDDLIKAVTPEMELHVVGHPYNAVYLHYLEELTQGKNVKFILDANDKVILAEYRAARVSVLPSVYDDVYGNSYVNPELLGLVLLEAQSCGTPVIGTRVGSLPEVVEVGKTGLLVEPNNPVDLREALERLINLDQAEYSRMAQAARQMVETNFTWGKVVERCLNSYRAAYKLPEFTANARTWAAFKPHDLQENVRIYSQISELLKLKPGGRLLDVACGSGKFLRRAKEVGFEPFGLNSAGEAARQVAQFADCPVHGDLKQLLASPDSPPGFDVIYCPNKLTFSDEVSTLLGEWCNLLEPGGLLIWDVEKTAGFEDEPWYNAFRKAGFHSIRRDEIEIEGVQILTYYLLVSQQQETGDLEYLFISNLYPPYYIGGYEMMCRDTVEDFKKAGHKVLVLTGQYGLPEPRLDEGVLRLLATGIASPNDSSLTSIDNLNGPLNAALLKECIRWTKPKRVILYNTFGLNTLAILKVLEELRIPRLMHLCDMHMLSKNISDYINYPEIKAKLLNPEMKLTAASQLIADFHIANGFPSNVFKIIYSYLDTLQLEAVKAHFPATTAQYSSENPFKILYAGQVYPEKGILLVVETAIRMVERFDAHVSLDIIGRGDKIYIASLKAIIQAAQERLGKTVPVKWHGFKPRAELWEQFHLYDSFIMGSISERPEPFGLVALEAMGVGLPVVVPDFSGASEIIQDGVNGLVAKIDEVDSFAEALWKLYSDPKLASKISQQARSTVLENFTGGEIVQDFQNAF